MATKIQNGDTGLSVRTALNTLIPNTSLPVFDPSSITLTDKETYFASYTQSGTINVTQPTADFGVGTAFLVTIVGDGSDILIFESAYILKNDFDSTAKTWLLVMIYDGTTWSYTLTAKSLLTQLNASVLTAGTVGSTTVDLSWTDTNSSPNETNIKVYYKESSSQDWILFNTYAADSTSAQVTGLTPETSYDFAVTNSGDGLATQDSPKSNTETETTTAQESAPAFTTVGLSAPAANIYTGTGSGFNCYGVGDTQATGDCYLAVEPEPNDSQFIGLTADGVNAGYTTLDFCIFQLNSTQVRFYEEGVVVGSTTAITSYTRYRIRRSGTTVTAEGYNGSSWVVMHTFATSLATNPYIHIGTYNGRTVQNPLAIL